MQPSRGVAFDSFMDRPQQQQQSAIFYMQQQQQQQQQLLQQQHYQQQQDSLAILPATTMTQYSTGELYVKNTTNKTTAQFLRFVLCSCTKLLPSSLDSFCCACSAANTLLPFTHIYTNMNRNIPTRWSRLCDPELCLVYSIYVFLYLTTDNSVKLKYFYVYKFSESIVELYYRGLFTLVTNNNGENIESKSDYSSSITFLPSTVCLFVYLFVISFIYDLAHINIISIYFLLIS